jgi:AP-2 complex subunit alpha
LFFVSVLLNGYLILFHHITFELLLSRLCRSPSSTSSPFFSLFLPFSPFFAALSQGYVAVAQMLNETNELLRLVIQTVKRDLASDNEVWQSMALSVVANVGGQEFAESLTSDVQNLLFKSSGFPFVRKKCALALLRMFRKYPDGIPMSDDFRAKLTDLLNEGDHGVRTSCLSLILGVVSHDPRGYECMIAPAVRMLAELVFSKGVHSNYKYYHTLCPWLQIKLLKLLQYFPVPEDETVLSRLHECLHNILTTTEVTRSVNKNNADHGVLFEAIHLIIHHCRQGSMSYRDEAIEWLGKFVGVREPNIKYLGLDSIALLSQVSGAIDNIKQHKSHVEEALNHPDVSVRRRAIDVMFAMCDRHNATEVVGELMKYLNKGDFSIKEELVLRIAILAEKFAPALEWYIDVILQLIAEAGDFVSDDIWYRVVQIVTNNDSLQTYAATKVLEALRTANVHENGIKVGGYIIGEFGHQVPEDRASPDDLFETLHVHFRTAQVSTKAILLSAYIKLSNAFPELRDRVNEVFDAHLSYVDAEIQQRAVEYSALNDPENDDILASVFEVMPSFSERTSALEKRIKKMKTADRNVFVDPDAKSSDAKESDDSDSGEEDDYDDSGSDFDEDEDQGEASDDGPFDESKKTRGTAAPVIDLLGVEEDIFGTGTASPSAGFAAQDEKVLPLLLGKETGVIYSHAGLQISVRIMGGTGAQTKMIMYYDTTTSAPISQLSLQPNELQGLRVQMKPSDPFTVHPSQTVQQYLLWKCAKPFAVAPTVKAEFTYQNASHVLDLKLPVTLGHFISAEQWDAARFRSEWKENVLAEQKVFQSENIVDRQDLINRATSTLNMYHVPQLEKSDDNFSLCGRLHSTAKHPTTGEPYTVPCLIRFETKPGTKFVRVTVRSGHQKVSASLVNWAGVIVGVNSM